jgi:hypothetical protein
MLGTQTFDGREGLLAPWPPGWWVFDDIDGGAEFVLHVLEDSIEAGISFLFSQLVH